MPNAKWTVTINGSSASPDVHELEEELLQALQTHITEFSSSQSVSLGSSADTYFFDIDIDSIDSSKLDLLKAKIQSQVPNIVPGSLLVQGSGMRKPTFYDFGISPFLALNQLYALYGMEYVVFRTRKASGRIMPSPAYDGRRDGWETLALNVAKDWYVEGRQSRHIICRAFSIAENHNTLKQRAIQSSDVGSLVFSSLDSIILIGADGDKKTMRVDWGGRWVGHRKLQGTRIIRCQIPDEHEMPLWWIGIDPSTNLEMVVPNPIVTDDDYGEKPVLDFSLQTATALLDDIDRLRFAREGRYKEVGALMTQLWRVFGDGSSADASAQRLACLRWGDRVHAGNTSSPTFREIAMRVLGPKFDFNHPLASDASYVIESIFPSLPDLPERAAQRLALTFPEFEKRQGPRLVFTFEGFVSSHQKFEEMVWEKLNSFDFVDREQFLISNIQEAGGRVTADVFATPYSQSSVGELYDQCVLQLNRCLIEMAVHMKGDPETHKLVFQGSDLRSSLGAAFLPDLIRRFGGRIAYGIVKMLRDKADDFYKNMVAVYGRDSVQRKPLVAAPDHTDMGLFDNTSAAASPASIFRLTFDNPVRDENAVEFVANAHFHKTVSAAVSAPTPVEVWPPGESELVSVTGPLISECDIQKVLKVIGPHEISVGTTRFNVDCRRMAYALRSSCDFDSLTWKFGHDGNVLQDGTDWMQPAATRASVLPNRVFQTTPQHTIRGSAFELAVYAVDHQKALDFVTPDSRRVSLMTHESDVELDVAEESVDLFCERIASILKAAFANDDCVTMDGETRPICEELRIPGASKVAGSVAGTGDPKIVRVEGQRMPRCGDGQPFDPTDALEPGRRYSKNGICFVNSIVDSGSIVQLDARRFVVALSRALGRRVRVREEAYNQWYECTCTHNLTPDVIFGWNGTLSAPPPPDTPLNTATLTDFYFEKDHPAFMLPTGAGTKPVISGWSTSAPYSPTVDPAFDTSQTFDILQVTQQYIVVRHTLTADSFVLTNPIGRCYVNINTQFWNIVRRSRVPSLTVVDIFSLVSCVRNELTVDDGGVTGQKRTMSDESSAFRGSVEVRAVNPLTNHVSLRDSEGRIICFRPAFRAPADACDLDGIDGGRFELMERVLTATAESPPIDKLLAEWKLAKYDSEAHPPVVPTPVIRSFEGLTREALTRLRRVQSFPSNWIVWRDKKIKSMVPNLYIFSDRVTCTGDCPDGSFENSAEDIFTSLGGTPKHELIFGSPALGYFVNQLRDDRPFDSTRKILFKGSSTSLLDLAGVPRPTFVPTPIPLGMRIVDIFVGTP